MTDDELVDALDERLGSYAEEAQAIRDSDPLGYDPGDLADGMEDVIRCGRRAITLYQAGRVDISLIQGYARYFRLG